MTTQTGFGIPNQEPATTEATQADATVLPFVPAQRAPEEFDSYSRIAKLTREARVAQWEPPRLQVPETPARRARRAVPIVTVAVEIAAMVAVMGMAVGLRAWLIANYDFESIRMGGHLAGHLSQASLVLGFWLLGLVASGAYSNPHVLTDMRSFTRVVHGSLYGFGLLGFVAYITSLDMSRGFLFFSLVLGVPTLVLTRRLERSVMARMHSKGKLLRPTLVVGSAEAVECIVDLVERAGWAGFDLIGAVATDGEPAEHYNIQMLGDSDDIGDIVARTGAESVIVAGRTPGGPEHLRKIGWALEGLDVDLLVAPSLIDVAGSRIQMRHVAGLPLLHIAEPSTKSARGIAKRVSGVAISAIMVTMLAPIFIAVALAIKLTDRGPVFFRQERVGVNGRTFKMIKFRSMAVDAESRLSELLEQTDGNGVLFKMKEDPRITRVGRFIRRYSLDELPQLFNVIKGDMSLVGPRPALPYEVDAYPDVVTRRLLVPPGITGLWQVSGRSDLNWEDSVRLDLYYVDNWSFTTDLAIMVKTVRAILKGSGAY